MSADPSVAPEPDESVERLRRNWLNEDWASVIVGLSLIALVLVGALPGNVIP